MEGAIYMVIVFRMLFALLDGAVYGFLANVYELLMKIANVEIFNYETIQKFSTRVYALLGIFMAFKLIFSFINYLVNPDSMSDAKTGGRKLVINIIVSLVLLIAVPTIIFPMAKDIQKVILQEGVLQKLILGIDSDGYAESLQVRNAARNMSFSVLNAFVYPNSEICTEEEATFVKDDEIAKDESMTYAKQDEERDYLYKLNGACAKNIDENIKDKDSAEDVVKMYERAYTQKSVKSLLSSTLYKAKSDKDEYIFDYKIFVSTIIGAAVVWILIMFCFQIALRTVKLGFLELIAPIPIISYMDTKAKAKSFDGWVKECISTYLGLFIRLAAIYFAVFVITLITRSGTVSYRVPLEGTTTTGMQEAPVGPVVTLFIIIGALMFASELPKLIEKITGIKMDGKFSLNPLKNSPVASAVVGGAVGLGIGAVGGFASNAAASRLMRKDLKKKIDKGDLKYDDLSKYQKHLVDGTGWLATGRSAVGGFFGGGTRSMIAAGKEGKSGKAMAGLTGAVTGVTKSSNIRRANTHDYNGRQRALNKITDIAGIEGSFGTTDQLKNDIKARTELLQNLKLSEQEAAHGMSILSGANEGKKYNSYRDAFKETTEILKDGTVNIKKDYENFDDYAKSLLSQAGKDTYQRILDNTTLSAADKVQYLDHVLSSELGSSIDTIITRAEYTTYNNVKTDRETYDKQAQKVQKEIDKLKETQKLGKPDKK